MWAFYEEGEDPLVARMGNLIFIMFAGKVIHQPFLYHENSPPEIMCMQGKRFFY